jgi:hypothetical protein
VRDYEIDVWEAAEGRCVQHIDDRARRFKCGFDQRRGTPLGGRGVGVGVYEHGCGEGVEFALDGVEAGVAEGDVVIYVSDNEAVGTQERLCVVDFFERGGGVVGGEGDEGGAVVVGGTEGGEARVDVAEHLHCYAGFVEVGEGAFKGLFEGRGDQEGAFAQDVPPGFELLWCLRRRKVPVEVNPSCSHI